MKLMYYFVIDWKLWTIFAGTHTCLVYRWKFKWLVVNDLSLNEATFSKGLPMPWMQTYVHYWFNFYPPFAWEQQKEPLHPQRMLGTFNQYVPMILSNNYWCQSNPRSLLDTGMDVPRVNRYELKHGKSPWTSV